MQKQAGREEGRNACRQQQAKKQSLAGKGQARADQKRHLGKQECSQAGAGKSSQRQKQAGRGTHVKFRG
jgi:hypothetical protein